MKISKVKLKWYYFYDIMGASNLSDTIVRYKKSIGGDLISYYQNMQTGKESSEFMAVLREDKRYILIDTDDSDLFQKGFLTKYFPEDDVVLAVFYRLKYICRSDFSWDEKFSWDEMFRIVITKNYCHFFDNGLNPLIYKCYNDAFDLCGQYIHTSFEFPNGYSSVLDSGEEMRKFCGGVFLDSSFTRDFTCASDIIEAAMKINKDKIAAIGIDERNMDDIVMEEKELPQETIYILEKTAWEHFKSAKTSRYNIKRLISGIAFSYLQYCSGEYVLRCFHVFVCGMPKKGEIKLPMKFIECKRIHLTEKTIENMSHIYVPILCYDKENITNGKFRYSVNYIDDAINYNTEVLSCSESWGFPRYCSENISIAYAMAYCPFVEKLVNYFSKINKVKDDDEDERVDNIFHILSKGGNSLDYFSEALGELDLSQSEMHKILMISKTALEIFKDKDYSFEVIRVFKEVFSENKDYMMHMDKDTICSIFSFLSNHRCMGTEDMGKCLSLFIDIFGYKSLAAFLKFFEWEYCSCKSDTERYIHYLEKLYVIRGHVDTALTWKVNREDLIKTDDSITEAYNVLNDKEKYGEITEKFKGFYKEWEKYEYQNYGYIVTYPKGPTDIIEEGIRLNHCVKTFVESVANRDTTILFIREEDAPNRPFFTLEVKGKEVRQCHGVNNCMASSNVLYFLEEFCKEKGIKISNTLNETLGVD